MLSCDIDLILIMEVATPEVKQWLGHLGGPKSKQRIQDQKAKADPHH